MSLYNVTNLIAAVIFNQTGVCEPTDYFIQESYAILQMVGLFVSYLVYLWAFVLDRLGTNLLI
ncbi:hypothetical protein RvY_10716 [Ramazzottius varieornatus]|uniref:Uncharacterized protein n=1 Tax=Ramazzottius varieornatus TaxID=947166 RepID=A0A1D1VDN1_RAMVA|nr:hypothetical protein RvY_10716 [Ramazzottius varieornatus]